MPAAYPPSPRPRLQLGPVTEAFSGQISRAFWFLAISELPASSSPGPTDDWTAWPWPWEEAGSSGRGRIWRNHLQEGSCSALSQRGWDKGGPHMCMGPTEGQVWAVCGWRLHHLPGSSSHCGLDCDLGREEIAASSHPLGAGRRRGWARAVRGELALLLLVLSAWSHLLKTPTSLRASV